MRLPSPFLLGGGFVVVSLFINLSDNNVLRKRLTTEIEYDCKLLEETSIIDPVFLIATPNLTNMNYLYCPSFKRYYFITDITSVRTGLWRVSCHVDVLMSFKEAISNIPAVISSQQSYSVGNSFLNDGTYVADTRVSTEVVNFPSGFTTLPQYILTTLGPGGTQVN